MPKSKQFGEVIPVKVSKSLKNRIRKAAESNEMSLSEFVRQAVLRGLKEEELKSPRGV